MSKNIEKTNVMRILDQKKVKYISHCYAETSAISGIDVATVLNQNPEQVFKTLVTRLAGSSERKSTVSSMYISSTMFLISLSLIDLIICSCRSESI